MDSLGFLATIVGTAAAGQLWCAGYNFFEGEGLPGDWIDELRIRLADLRRLDLDCRSNPRRSDAVISLTTIPTRLPFLDDTIKSLLRQRTSPAEIRLNVPRMSRREKRPYELPAWIQELESVRIVPCEDFGPSTKLLPSLTALSSDARIIVVDDDKIYPSTFVEDLVAASDKQPDAAVGLSGWDVPEDLTDRPTTVMGNLLARAPVPHKARRQRVPRRVDILQGTSGYLVRPSYFDLEKLFNYEQAPKAAFFVDDVWISGHCHVAKYVVPARRTAFESWSRRTWFKRSSLGLLNRGGGDPEKRNNTITIRHLREAWLCERQ